MPSPSPGAGRLFALADGRSPDNVAYPEIGEAYRAMKSFAALGIAYQGYGDLVPRLAAAVVSVLPIGWWPAGVTLIAAFLEGACAALVFCSSAPYISTPWIRGVLALLVVCVPAAHLGDHRRDL